MMLTEIRKVEGCPFAFDCAGSAGRDVHSNAAKRL